MFSRTRTRSISSYLCPGTSVMTGRTLAYRSNSFRIATLMERNPELEGVVSGPFRATPVCRIESRVSLGSGSSTASSAATPPSWWSYSNSAPASRSTASVASVTSGPIPSPGITVIVLVKSDGLP